MTITSILITPEGTAKGDINRFPLRSQWIEFEDQAKAKEILWDLGIGSVSINGHQTPAGLYAVGPLEVEPIMQKRKVNTEQWIDMKIGERNTVLMNYAYREVLRITEKSK